MNPRDRIASHLRRILVAAGMALPQPGHADTSTPKPPGDDGKGKKPEGNKKKEPEHLGYEVVDMLPEPFIEKKETGLLDLRSHPSGAAVSVDGKSLGKKTPLSRYKLAVGTHVLTLRLGNATQNLTVEIKKDEPTAINVELRPSPAPEPKK